MSTSFTRFTAITILLSLCFCFSALAQQVEILGTWSLTDQFGEMTITVSDSAFLWQRPALSMQGSAKITYYDNSSNVLIMRHTVHPDPAQLNKFARVTWTPAVPGLSADVCMYQPRSTQDSALIETLVFPDDYPRPATKTQTSIFTANNSKSIIPATIAYRTCFISRNSYTKAEGMFSINGTRISTVRGSTRIAVLKNQ